MIESIIDRVGYEYGILQDAEDYRAGRLETVSHEGIMEEFCADE